jgi:hypothetical protein
MKSSILIFLLLLAGNASLLGQELGGDSIDKPTFKPSLVAAPTGERKAVIMRPSADPQLQYQATTLKPLSITTNNAEQNNNYVQLSAGNLKSINASGLYQFKVKKNSIYLTGFTNNANAANYQQYSNTHGTIGVLTEYQKKLFGAELNIQRDKYFDYGGLVPSLVLPQNGAALKLELLTKEKAKGVNLALLYKAFSAYKANETQLRPSLQYFNRTKQWQREVNIHAALNGINVADSAIANNLFWAGINLSHYRANKFANLGMALFATNRGVRLMPNFIVERRPNKNLNLRAHWQRTYFSNSLSNILEQNPFVQNVFTFTPTIKNEFLVQATHVLKGATSVSIGAGGISFENMLLYRTINEATAPQLAAQYHTRQTAFVTQASISYAQNQDFNASLKGELFLWSPNTTFPKLWHMPNWNLQAQLFKRINAKSNISARWDVWGHRFAAPVSNLDDHYGTGMVNNLNLRANYNLNKRWKLFLEANNLLNSSYDIWYQYRVLPRQILGGVYWKI